MFADETNAAAVATRYFDNQEEALKWLLEV
jgi:hypothetical protein